MANPGTELASLDFGNLIGGPLVAGITAQSIAARSTADFIKTVGFYPEGTKDGDTDIGNTPVYVEFKYPKEVQPYQPGQTYYRISEIEILEGGAGYSAATITLSGAGDGETAAGTITATVAGGAITAFTLASNTGSYKTTPTITITPAAADTITTEAKVAVKMVIERVESPTLAVFQDMKISVPILTMLPIPFIKIDKMTVDFNAKINSIETRSESTDVAIAGNLQVQQRWPGGGAKLNVSASYKKSSASGESVERTYSMQVHVEASQDEMPAGMEKLLGILEAAMISRPA